MRTLLCAALFLGLLAARLPGRDELNLFAWSEYVPQKVIDGFTKETGIEVNYETFASNEEMISKLVAGRGDYDLIQPSDYAAEALIRANLLAPLDPARRLSESSTAIDSSLSCVHDRRLRLSDPTIAHTSSTTTTLACT